MENIEITSLESIILSTKLVLQNFIFTETQKNLIFSSYVNYNLINTLLSETTQDWDSFDIKKKNLIYVSSFLLFSDGLIFYEPSRENIQRAVIYRFFKDSKNRLTDIDSQMFINNDLLAINLELKNSFLLYKKNIILIQDTIIKNNLNTNSFPNYELSRTITDNYVYLENTVDFMNRIF